MISNNKLNQYDLIILLTIALSVVLHTAISFNPSYHPFEDAAILMRYSINFAEGQGIRWNDDEEPVDGATDFLFMIIIGIFCKAGFSVEHAVRLLGLFSHYLTIFFIYFAIRKIFGLNPWLAMFSSLFFSVGPGLKYIEAGFGTPFFALFSCSTWYFANVYIMKQNKLNALIFTFSELILGLIRPEGVFLSIFMLISIIYMIGFKKSFNVIISFLVVFIIFGSIYFIWRWNYFSYPLPNPFYIKGGGLLYVNSLIASIRNSIGLCNFSILFLLAGLLFRSTYKKSIFALIPITLFILIWIFLSDLMNYAQRFQYAIVPIALISWSPIFIGMSEEWLKIKINGVNIMIKLKFLLTILIFIAIVIYLQNREYIQLSYQQDGRYDIGLFLSHYSNKRYKIALTEAGLIPLYSNWNVLDAKGLNDKYIAHHGEITESYLERYEPHIIMFHAYFSPLTEHEYFINFNNTWHNRVVNTLYNFAERNNYILAAVFGDNPHDTHYYYVRDDFPDSKEIINAISNFKYKYYNSGYFSINYSNISYIDK